MMMMIYDIYMPSSGSWERAYLLKARVRVRVRVRAVKIVTR